MNWWQKILALVPRARPAAQGTFYTRGAGMVVSTDTALNSAAVWSCVRIISETVATLGWHIIENGRDGERERIQGSPVDWLLNSQANPEMTAFTWRESALMQTLLTGNHYSEIGRDMAGRPNALWPLDPYAVKVDRDEVTGALVYRVSAPLGGETILPARNVLHIHGPGWDGTSGMSVIAVARRSIGAALATDEFGANFYANGAHIGAALKHPGKLSENAKDYLKASFKDAYAGAGGAFKTIVLEEGMDVAKLTMSMIDAQFLESRKFQVSEVCRWFRVPPHKVADLDRATFSNIEHQSIEFVQDTILPWCRRLEQEADIKLVGDRRQGLISTRLNIDTLLRGDIVSRFNAYEKGRLGGWLSANDVRRLENLNPIENGDIYLQPMNYIEAGEKPEPVAAPAPAAEPEPPDSIDDDDGNEQPSNVIRRAALEWRSRNG
jgi:HK97 family phage portal protein